MNYVATRVATMPKLLMLLSLAPWAVMAMLFCASVAPGFQIDVSVTLVSRGDWWASGGGAMVTIGLVIFTAQLFAIVYRLRFAELIIGGAWLVFSLVELLIGPPLSESVVGSPSWENWSMIAATSAILGLVSYFLAKFVPAHQAYLASV